MRRLFLVPACLMMLSLCFLAAGSSASLPAASLVTAATGCGSCSFRGCVGAAQGHACVTFAGAAGTCQATGKICGDHSNHCGCY
jgi:hypothetical protein